MTAEEVFASVSLYSNRISGSLGDFGVFPGCSSAIVMAAGTMTCIIVSKQAYFLL